MTYDQVKQEAKRYIGVYPTLHAGRPKFGVKCNVNGETHYLGNFDDPKQAAKAYDMFVLREQLERKTNFIKKKVAHHG